jgi:hypothetical protein
LEGLVLNEESSELTPWPLFKNESYLILKGYLKGKRRTLPGKDKKKGTVMG